MARRRKDGRRATGVQAKSGRLYIFTTQNVVKDGQVINRKIWKATGLTDTPENVQKAVEARQNAFGRKTTALIDHNITVSGAMRVCL